MSNTQITRCEQCGGVTSWTVGIGQSLPISRTTYELSPVNFTLCPGHPRDDAQVPTPGVIGLLVERILAAGFCVGVLNRPGDYLLFRICADAGETMLSEEWALTHEELKCGPKEVFVDLCDQRIQRLREAIAERKAGDDDL